MPVCACKDCRELKGGTPAPNRVSYDLKEVKKDCDYLTATKMRVEGGNYNEKFSLKTLLVCVFKKQTKNSVDNIGLKFSPT